MYDKWQAISLYIYTLSYEVIHINRKKLTPNRPSAYCGSKAFTKRMHEKIHSGR